LIGSESLLSTLLSQEERAQFQGEVESYRNKLTESEKEVAILRSQVAGSKTANEVCENLTSVRFEKEALETKLRKYITYCKALESDKTQIIDALRAHRREVIDDDFAGAVVSLCDQLTSLEEECDALSRAEGRASSYLLESERLHEQISSLKIEVEQSQKKVMELTSVEAELTARLKKAEEKNVAVREDQEKLRSRAGGTGRESVPEKSRQVKYLEQENLQLMLDLKAAKKQLQTARSELDVLRMQTLDDDTEDFAAYVAPAPKPITSSRKRTISKLSAGSNDVFADDKENQVNITESSQGSTTKQRFSRGKVARMRESNRGSVGLGEAGPDEENTGECRQS
jgi:chromosome segregation ATPase